MITACDINLSREDGAPARVRYFENPDGSIIPIVQLDGGITAQVEFPASVPVTGPLTDAQLRANPLSVAIAGGVGVGLTNAELRATPLPVSGPLTDAQLRATALLVTLTANDISDRAARLLGHVTIDNASLAVTGPATDAQLRATALPVSGPATDAQLRASALPVSLAANTPDVIDRAARLLGHVTIDNANLPVTGPATDAQLRASALPVSGPLTDAQLRATALLVSLTANDVSDRAARLLGHVTIDNASLAVTGPATDAQLRAVALPVSGPLTDIQLRATALPVSGPATDAQLRASALPVSLATNTPDVIDRAARLLGHITVDNASLAVTGPATDAQLRASALPVSLAVNTPDIIDRAARLLGHITVDNASLAVTGPATDAQLRASALPVSGPATDAQLRASALPVSLAVNTPDIIDRAARLLGHITVDNASLAVIGPATDAQLRASALPVSGPLTDAQLRATPLAAPALTKGTQGAAGHSVQNLKDAGRNAINYFMALAVAATNAEVMMSFTGYKGGVAVGPTVSPAVVTAGKIFRFQLLWVNYMGIAAATMVAVRLRINLTGLAVIGSALAAVWYVGVPAAVAGVSNSAELPLPDGFEIPAGAGFGISIQGFGATNVAAAGGFAAINSTAFEY